MTTGSPRHTWTDNVTAITAAKLNETEQDVADALATAADNTTALAGKASTSHTHGVTDLTATGTKDGTKYLRDDNTWAVPAGGSSYTDEQVRDVMGTALVAGTNVTITPNDGADTITIAAAGGGGSYTDEQVRDVMGAALVAGSNVTITPNDGADTITIAATGGGTAAATLGNRVVFLGDSMTIGSDNNSPPSNGSSWPTYASLFSKQRILKVRNAGVAGETTAQMLSRFSADVTPYDPSVVTIVGGRNDISQSVTLATFQSNIASLVSATRAIGAVPVLGTINPTNGTPRQTTLNWNAWLRFYAASEGLSLIPFHAAMVDPATGNYLSAYNSGDNVHPNQAGYAQMGRVAAATLAPLLPDWSGLLPVDYNDTANLKTGGIITGPLDSNGGPTPNWDIANPGQVTATLDSTDPTVKGAWWRGVVSSSTADVDMFTNNITGLVAGHRYAFVGRVKSNLTAGRIQAVATLSGNTDLNLYGVVDLTQTIDDGVWWVTGVCPASTAAPTLDVHLKIMSGSTGVVQWAQVGVYDLTALGLATLA